SDCGRAGFAGADADDLLPIEDEDLAVADLAGAGGVLDRLDGLGDELVGDARLDLDLRQEADDALRAALEPGRALLAAEALHLGDGDALDADARKGLPDFVELERLDDGGDEFHGFSPWSGGIASAARAGSLRRTCRPTARPCPCRAFRRRRWSCTGPCNRCRRSSGRSRIRRRISTRRGCSRRTCRRVPPGP